MKNTYCLRLVIEFLKSQNIPFEYVNSKVGFLPYNHGCNVKLSNAEYYMSIQTHPSVCGNSFAETAVLSVNGGFALNKYNYNDDVIRHDTPDALFSHIMDCINE